jgi:hypothetical protein
MIEVGRFNAVEVWNGYGWVLGHRIPTCMYFEMNDMYIVFLTFLVDS